jgi:hypothetical protein
VGAKPISEAAATMAPSRDFLNMVELLGVAIRLLCPDGATGPIGPGSEPSWE